MSRKGRVAVFGPHPMLSITIEALTAAGGDDIHLHAAGQGVWVARMAAELGANPVLCGFIGGETGAVLRPLLEQTAIELRLVETAEGSGSYLHDRRGGKREPIAQAAALPPSRHEVDELFSSTVAVALDADVLALCGPYPGEALPLEIYGNLVTDVRANGTPVVVDLSPPRLDSALSWSRSTTGSWPSTSTDPSTARSGCSPRRGACWRRARERRSSPAPRSPRWWSAARELGSWSHPASSAAPARVAAIR
jgi:sugar/nucleoside kinase (ribokinase family)